MVKRTMGSSEWGLVGLLALVWGGTFYFVEILLDAMDPISAVLLRVAPAALVLTILVYITGRRLPGDFATWRALFIMGLLNNVAPFTLIAWGQTHIESGLAAILNATTPLFTVLLAHWLTRDEPMSANRGMGVVVGFAGVALLIGPDALSGLGADVMAQAAVLAAAISYALAGVHGRRLAALPTTVAAAGMLIASTCLMIPMTLIGGDLSAITFSSGTIGALLGQSLLSTALAYLIYFRVLARAGATNLLLVTFLLPPIALVLGVAALGENPSPQSIAGMGVIFLGLILVDGRMLKLWRRARQ